MLRLSYCFRLSTGQPTLLMANSPIVLRTAQVRRPTPDGNAVLHTRRLLSTPDAIGLADLLKTEHRLLEEVLFRTIELAALVESGQHRFIGRALDDLERAKMELGEAEMVRAAMTEAILGRPPGEEPGLDALLETVDDDRSETLRIAGQRLSATLGELTSVSARATVTAAGRLGRVRRAIQTASSETAPHGRA